MYTFKLTEQFLSLEEKLVFTKFLNHHDLKENIWEVFESLFRSSLKGITPLVLKAYEDDLLCGAAIIVKCSKYTILYTFCLRKWNTCTGCIHQSLFRNR